MQRLDAAFASIAGEGKVTTRRLSILTVRNYSTRTWVSMALAFVAFLVPHKNRIANVPPLSGNRFSDKRSLSSASRPGRRTSEQASERVARSDPRVISRIRYSVAINRPPLIGRGSTRRRAAWERKVRLAHS